MFVLRRSVKDRSLGPQITHGGRITCAGVDNRAGQSRTGLPLLTDTLSSIDGFRAPLSSAIISDLHVPSDGHGGHRCVRIRWQTSSGTSLPSATSSGMEATKRSNKDIDSRLFPPPFDAPGHAAYSRCYSAIPDMLMIIIIIIIDLSFAINWREAHLVAPRGPSQSQASGIITVHYKLVCLGDYRLAEVETTHPTTTYSVRADKDT